MEHADEFAFLADVTINLDPQPRPTTEDRGPATGNGNAGPERPHPRISAAIRSRFPRVRRPPGRKTAPPRKRPLATRRSPMS